MSKRDPRHPESIEYLFPNPPAPGETIEVAPGIHWLKTPLPFQGLKAINLYLLRDGEGWTIVDSGYGRDDVREQWRRVWATVLGDRPVTRLIITHFHPDHMGNSGWIGERWGLVPWMTQAEWFAANLAVRGANTDDIAARLRFYRSHGLDGRGLELFATGVVRYEKGVTLPPGYRRLFDGETIGIDGREWRVIVGHGHSPEHATLFCDELGVLISGDQILPEITTNVSAWQTEPEGNPLALFLATIERLRGLLPKDVLVCPAHRSPFTGVHARLDQLVAHHESRLAAICEAARSAVTAGDLLPLLFPMKLDGHQMGFAMGEAVAHLNYLVHRGRLNRTTGDDGVIRFARAA